ncbi:hypothetical protein BpHYR1_008719 [Brachionus plicatilis]|uniref:Uncharacterized protein n=1 Tax=Brachionus plicatilis TaxID=10195 RepID=A0A3M7SQQ6_BRAPC|nr:hypothetical protein BpHYR1_008719 [Brachionus plicatilis]
MTFGLIDSRVVNLKSKHFPRVRLLTFNYLFEIDLTESINHSSSSLTLKKKYLIKPFDDFIEIRISVQTKISHTCINSFKSSRLKYLKTLHNF